MRKTLSLVGGIFCSLVLILILFFYFYSPGEKAQAISTDNVIGWAWSENIGWISNNCYNDYNDDGVLESHCSDQINPDTGLPYKDYGINIDTISGPVIGYAWSENIGWTCLGSTCKDDPLLPPQLDNNPEDGLPAQATYDPTTGEISGWANIVSLIDNGWTKLQGPVVAAPVSYALCRNCIEGDCNFCYELNTNGGSGKIGTVCSSCAGVPASCGSCSNVYQYGVSALPYSIKDLGIRYVLEGWAWNGEDNAAASEKPIGWIHFNYAYANSNVPLAFNSLIVVPSQTTPPSACNGADLSWEVSSWANKYEIKRSNGSASSQNCSVVAYPNSDFINVSDYCNISGCGYTNSGLAENKYYCYKILAWNDTGFTTCTDCPQGTGDPTCPAPAEEHSCPKEVKLPLCAPSDFTADGATCGEINLSWTDKTGETGYKVYRSLTDVSSTSSATLIATLGANATSYKDETIIPRQTYYYQLTALTAADESPSAKVSGQTLCYKGAGWEEK